MSNAIETIARFVATDEGKKFYRAAYDKRYRQWHDQKDLAYRRSNARADMFRDVQHECGYPGDSIVDYDTLQDYFTLNMFRGKNVEKIQEKLERLV